MTENIAHRLAALAATPSPALPKKSWHASKTAHTVHSPPTQSWPAAYPEKKNDESTATANIAANRNIRIRDFLFILVVSFGGGEKQSPLGFLLYCITRKSICQAYE